LNSPKHAPEKLHHASAADTAKIFTEAMAQQEATNHDVAEKLYRQVLAIDPDHVGALYLLSGLLAARGLLGPAIDLIRRVIRLEPKSHEAQYNLGTMLLHLGQSDDALAAFERAIELKPDYAKAHNNRGVALQNLRRNEEASAAHRRATELQPDFAQAHSNLGVALQNVKRLDEALIAYARAINLMPNYAKAYSHLGATLKELGRNDEAIAPCLRAIELAPDLAEAHNHLGNALKDLGQYERSIAAYRRAIELKPDFAVAYANLSVALQEFGHGAEAREMVERSLKLDPGSAHAWYALSDMKKFAAADPDIDQMEALRASADARRLDLEERAHILFALGKAWLDAGNADRAFAYLNEGNRLHRTTLAHDADAAADRSAAIARSCPSTLLNEFAGRGDASDRPIFVVGMPRSGTTLIEQILASHPAVHGAGELRFLEEVVDGILGPDNKPIGYPRLFAELRFVDLAACGRSYVERVSALAPPEKRHVIDKMPANFFFAGLIRLMLPNARIIHVRRDAVDTCLSCYVKKFASGQNFTYDLRELGAAYRSYEALMQHWRDVLPPERFIEVRYEDVVDDLEAQARRLVDFCGLEWSEACLSFHKTSRPVRTASFNQVRQPLYRTSIGRWKPYAHHLEPLLAALRLTPGLD
jgi:tetratricopeptide (TPR) repeat protein